MTKLIKLKGDRELVLLAVEETGNTLIGLNGWYEDTSFYSCIALQNHYNLLVPYLHYGNILECYDAMFNETESNSWLNRWWAFHEDCDPNERIEEKLEHRLMLLALFHTLVELEEV